MYGQLSGHGPNSLAFALVVFLKVLMEKFDI